VANFEELKNQWKDWSSRPFPDISTNAVENVDLISLDYSTAGCIGTFVHYKGNLDVERIAYLKKACRELDEVVRHLDGSPKAYFVELQTLTRGVLEHVGN
jgi:hypothetical protein